MTEIIVFVIATVLCAAFDNSVKHKGLYTEEGQRHRLLSAVNFGLTVFWFVSGFYLALWIANSLKNL